MAANIDAETISSKDWAPMGSSGTFVYPRSPANQTFMVLSDTTGLVNGAGLYSGGVTSPIPVIAGSVTRVQFVSIDLTASRANTGMSGASLTAIPV